jgi:Fe-S oxidoreductase/nitrate reductase gamma subunit
MFDTPTREIFAHFPDWMQWTFYAVAGITSLAFLYGFYRRYKKYRRGRAVNRLNNIGERIRRALVAIAQNRTIFHRDTYAGLSHFLIFWGFVVLFIGTVLVAIDHDILRFFGMKILQGTFYLWFSVVLDIFGVLFLIGLAMMMVRRSSFHLPQLDYHRADAQNGKYNRTGYALDDKMFLTLLFLIGVTGYLIEGFRIAEHMPEFERWSPVGWMLAEATNGIGLHTHVVPLHLASWWVHAVLVMVFLAYLPYSKAMHIFTDLANLIFKDPMAARRLPRPAEGAPKPGYRTITDFTWKELLDLDACTKCGRCHVACPAHAAGTTLSPRDVILDLRTYADATFNTSEWFGQKFLNDSKWPTNGNADIAHDLIRPETLWSCTTCMACVEACPVGIEHLTHIVQMRRNLVDAGTLDNNLQGALQNLGEYGNSFGQSPKNRTKWTQKLSMKPKDARKEPVEYLWYVGDFASFDPRLQAVSQTVADVFHKAGVDFGILYDAEKNAGNDVRRVGEEGLYEMLVEDNLATLKKAKFKEIVTTDPHTLNTLRNEYPEFGSTFTVHHYTGLLAKLIDAGKLTFSKQLNYPVTYHDPCYLARYNRETDAPRQVMKALGLDLREMPRCRENTFCCGAGGGRIWMDTSNEKKRTSEQRIDEALGLGGVRYFITCCPKDFTMYSDAVKTSGNEGKIEVKDLIELVAEAIA